MIFICIFLSAEWRIRAQAAAGFRETNLNLGLRAVHRRPIAAGLCTNAQSCLRGGGCRRAREYTSPGVFYLVVASPRSGGGGRGYGQNGNPRAHHRRTPSDVCCVAGVSEAALHRPLPPSHERLPTTFSCHTSLCHCFVSAGRRWDHRGTKNARSTPGVICRLSSKDSAVG